MVDTEPIKARIAAAWPTREPWQRQWFDESPGGAGWAVGLPVPPHGRITGWAAVALVFADSPGRGTYYGRGREALADLIAQAPADLAALLAEVDTLRDLLGKTYDKLPEGYTVLRGTILTALGYRGCTGCGLICVDCLPAAPASEKEAGCA